MRAVRDATAAVVGALLLALATVGAAGAAGDGGVGTVAAQAPAVRPVDGAVVRPFDPPAGPYAPGHRGVDLAARPGTSVRAALSGRVTFAGRVARLGWVTVAHGGGLETTYGALDPRGVVAGQAVQAGQPLGQVAPGSDHLDWGARVDGEYIDPLGLLDRWRPHLVRAP